MSAISPRTRQALVVLSAVVIAVLVVWARSTGGAGSTLPGSGTSPATALRAGQVLLTQLPPQAQETVALIDRGGPYPYPRDGVTFRNAEGLLPPQPGGYYHEYTVPTPGSSDRGARRIVSGQSGELFYTGDHYRTFSEIVRVTVRGQGGAR